MNTTDITQKRKNSGGYLLVLVLVFGAIFLVMISSFVGFVVTQNQVVNFRFEQQRATDIAEAGLNYYRWFLAHNPDDVTNGTGVPGPYVYEYVDPEGAAIGEYSLDVASSSYCGSISDITVTSTGSTYQNPAALSRISGRYAKPTVAEYSFITNAGVRYGASSVVQGPIHSNQGIRMDASHNSTVSSVQSTTTCDSSFGCSPSQQQPGVYTLAGTPNPGLFEYPATLIDFTRLALNLGDMKTRAENNGGIYYGPAPGSNFGYRLTFNGNNTVTIRRVTGTVADYRSESTREGVHFGERNVITTTSLVATRTINPACPLIYIEDKVWIEGVVNQKVAVAAADLVESGNTPMVLNGNITYAAGSNAGLLAIAEGDIDVGLQVPNNMTISGIFISQDGRYGRNHYTAANVGSSLAPYVIRNRLELLGTIVTKERAGTRWVNSSGVTLSGFNTGSSSFDRAQVDNPPPLIPATSEISTFSNWNQEG
jgi:hypothetical protein